MSKVANAECDYNGQKIYYCRHHFKILAYRYILNFLSLLISKIEYFLINFPHFLFPGKWRRAFARF